MLTSRFKSKTYWLGFAVSLLGYAEASLHLVRDHIGEDKYGVVLFGIGLLIFLLREFTTKPVGEK